jgi:protein gp37
VTVQSKIEWTEQTWNPVAGCTKISSGCDNCYAEVMARRLKAMGVSGYQNGFEISIVSSRLSQPLRRKKPTMYFVNSMSDLFHKSVPFSYIDEVLNVIRQTPQHKYQILTKRASRMAKYFNSREVPQNIWLGVTVENKRFGLPRIDLLRNIDAPLRFLSVEPLLENLGQLKLNGIHWVIVGGESGPYGRAMSPDWVSSIKRQCENKDISFFFKQWGRWGADGQARNKRANGKELEGQIWNAMPVTV